MKVLVTGGTGFTGKALVKRLLDDGHQLKNNLDFIWRETDRALV